MTNPNDPAFPETSGENGAEIKKGLSKREYFAAMAMQAIVSNPDYLKAIEYIRGNKNGALAIAEYAEHLAMALIEELSK